VGLVAGVLAVNAVFVAVGYGLLASVMPLRASYAGVALIGGAAATGVGVFLAAIAGMHIGWGALALVASLLVAAGLVAAARLGRARSTPGPDLSREGAALLALLVAVVAVVLVGGFRTVPWLDDSWGIWFPKAVALSQHGLAGALFAPNGTYVSFEVPDYPLWWSSVLALDLRAVGSVDVRIIDAQLALLVVAFAASLVRLLWGRVRQWLLLACTLLVVASPEFLRHAQSGAADLPLAIFVSLAALGGALWLACGDRLGLVLCGICAAAAIATKTEGAAEVALLLAVGVVACRRRALPLVVAVGAAFATAVPWWAWRNAHDVPERIPLRDLLDPSYLGDRAGRIGDSAATLAGHMLSPGQWFALVPLLLAACVLAARRTPAAFAPAAAVVLGWAFLVWVYWAARDDLDYLLGTSSYRTVDPFVLLAGVFLAPVVELLLTRREARSAVSGGPIEPPVANVEGPN
jgi:hypothetical protein